MDRTRRAVDRLWGSLDDQARLHPTPAFAAELAARCNGSLGLRAGRVSRWSFGEHVEHLYRTSHYVLDRLEESMAGLNAAGRMGPYGYGLMVAGFIPRGVFPTIPPLEPASGTLEHIEPLRENLDARLRKIAWDLRQIKASIGRSRHPRMKFLTSSQWFFFTDIHHRHHLSILDDIRKAAG